MANIVSTCFHRDDSGVDSGDGEGESNLSDDVVAQQEYSRGWIRLTQAAVVNASIIPLLVDCQLQSDMKEVRQNLNMNASAAVISLVSFLLNVDVAGVFEIDSSMLTSVVIGIVSSNRHTSVITDSASSNNKNTQDKHVVSKAKSHRSDTMRNSDIVVVAVENSPSRSLLHAKLLVFSSSIWDRTTFPIPAPVDEVS